MQERPLKIVRIIARLNIGGPAVHAVLLSQGLNRGRFQTTLLVGSVGAGEEDMGYFAAEHGVIPQVVEGLGPEISIKDDGIALWRILRILRRERPDIVHTHTAKAGTLGRLAAFLYNVGCRLEEVREGFRRRAGLSPQTLGLGGSPSGPGGDFTGSGGAPGPTGAGTRPRARLVHTFHGHVFHGYFSLSKVWLFVQVELVLARYSDCILTVSDALREELCERYRICPKEKVEVVSLGLDLSWTEKLENHRGELRRELKVPKEAATVGIVGRLTPVKDHDLFLEAAGLIQEQGVSFLVVGDGEGRRRLEQKARALKLDGRVCFAGWQRSTAKIYADLDLVCLTSKNEGTPMTLIEAMAAGLPFVATDVGGVRDLAGPERTSPGHEFRAFAHGLLVRPGDAQGLAKAISYLIARPEERCRLGEAGKAFARKRFSEERLMQDMALLYERMLKLSN